MYNLTGRLGRKECVENESSLDVSGGSTSTRGPLLGSLSIRDAHNDRTQYRATLACGEAPFCGTLDSCHSSQWRARGFKLVGR